LRRLLDETYIDMMYVTWKLRERCKNAWCYNMFSK